ncbi:hypothetical protein BHY07_17275 [Bacillus subtilis subsp. subtilis]|uniref:Uncharacterized protein YuzC n=3 Tax=Bacillus subtilis subsp. subtilis TaxID=135461 RepID=YUZC_BACSU|nr:MULTISPECIES: hypothetical protein [Bacillales]NP_391051.2 inner spore coat protein [Bacillus subtilis subsp. subtilis str. 168]O32089.2 RecName: Full=Uncharacterized protein YuzC [Bacillus subtilis subsp. subtilis str. 168]BAM55244.1 inner spore coat protein [Bacillus subtilis BEST7613]AFQ59019.1 Inner spore coat protein [Bacillus subtilis QB928]AGG62579.1 inner spore coat protein YuzC [Bacillus subtilis subsp. subtilis 6051-HGW]AHA79099.1 Uncharacterized protein yuzC [Bacillus subtilis P
MRYRYPWFYVYPYEVRRPPAPANNIDTFIRSAKQAAGIFADAQLVLSRIAGSRELSRRILTAAEQSDKQTIRRLIKQMGVRHEVDTVFNPDGIYISLIGTQSRMILALRWSEDRNHFASIRL